MRKAIEFVVTAYEDGKHGYAQEIMQFTLIPQFKNWKGMLDEGFGGFILN